MKKDPSDPRGRIFDTVKVDLPAPAGSSYELFRDLSNKGDALTSFRTSRRIASGQKAHIDRVGIQLLPWSGDDLGRILRLSGHLRIKVNRHLLLNRLLRDIEYTSLEVDYDIVDNDDLEGSISIGGSPWDAPSVTEWKEVMETEDEQLLLPGPLSKLNPVLRRSRTTMRPVSRPQVGSYLVTVYLEGIFSIPVGA